MEKYLYSIYDLKALSILSGIIQIIPSDAAADRWFRDLLATPETGNLHKYPEDFVLVRVGTIDEDTLTIKSYSVGPSDPVSTGAAILADYRRREQLSQLSPEPSGMATDLQSGDSAEDSVNV